MAVIREDNKGGYKILAVESEEAMPVMSFDHLKVELAGAERYAENLHHKMTDVQADNNMLRLNVKELQEQLNEAQKRIVALFDHSGASDGAIKVLHKEMREQGYDPTDEDDVEKYWDDVREN